MSQAGKIMSDHLLLILFAVESIAILNFKLCKNAAYCNALASNTFHILYNFYYFGLLNICLSEYLLCTFGSYDIDK